MDASLFDYKNQDQVHFSVTKKAFSLCQKMPHILSDLWDIYTSFHNTLPIGDGLTLRSHGTGQISHVSENYVFRSHGTT